MKYNVFVPEEKIEKKPAWSYELTEQKLKTLPDPDPMTEPGFWAAFMIFSYALNARQGEPFSITQQSIEYEGNSPDIIRITILTEKLGTNHPQRYRTIPLDSGVSSFEKWLVEKIKLYQSKIPPGDTAFFKDIGFATDYNINTLLRYARRNANKLFKVNHHFLRHCRLTHYVKNFGYNTYELQQVAGWRDIRTSLWYVRMQTKDLEDKLANLKITGLRSYSKKTEVVDK